MPECIIAGAGDADIRHVIDNLRSEHVRELRDASSLDPGAAIRLSVANSLFVMCGKIDERALFLIGIGKKALLDETGSVWMVATPEIDAHPLEAATAIRLIFHHAHPMTRSKRLEQWIPAWYGKGIKFAEWLGWRREGTEMINGVEHEHMVHEEAAA